MSGFQGHAGSSHFPISCGKEIRTVAGERILFLHFLVQARIIYLEQAMFQFAYINMGTFSISDIRF
jgi:hypothetical protein